jgi:mono/diheme cytochrome c family protein
MKAQILTMFALVMFSAQVMAWDAEKEFKTNCATCHSIGSGDVDAAGKKLQGPDLAGVSKRRNLDWIVKFVKYPEGMFMGDDEEAGYEKVDPIAAKVYALYKPNQMADQELDKAQVQAMLKYIDSKKKQPKGKIACFEKSKKTAADIKNCIKLAKK